MTRSSQGYFLDHQSVAPWLAGDSSNRTRKIRQRPSRIAQNLTMPVVRLRLFAHCGLVEQPFKVSCVEVLLGPDVQAINVQLC